MDAAPPHANCGVFPRGSWLAGLVGPSGPLEIPPADHPFWRERAAPQHALRVFSQLEEEKRVLSQQLKDTQEAKAATSSAVEWLQASNKKLTDKAAVLQTEMKQMRSQLSQTPQDVRNALAAQTREVEALREELRELADRHDELSAQHADLLDLQADTEAALLDAHTLLQQADVAPPSRAPTPLGADAAVRSLHSELRAAREAAEAAMARARAAEQQRAASDARVAAAEARAQAAEDRLAQGAVYPSPAPSPQPQSPSASPSGGTDPALAAARNVIRRLESQLDSANRQLARSKGAVVGVDGAVDAATYSAAESEACEAREALTKALTKLDWAMGQVKALTTSLEEERKQARERELRLKAKVDALQATGTTPTRASEEASLRMQLREARAAGDAARTRERTLEQRVFALERQCAALSESNAAAAEMAAVSLAQQ